MEEMKTGFIYKICCLDPTVDKIYVGSCNSMKDRKWRHKHSCKTETNPSYNYPVYQYIRENGGWNNFDFVILEEIEYRKKHELHSRERYFIEILKASLNQVIPTRTDKEHYEANKEKINEQKKKWVKDNAEKNKQYHDQYYQDNKDKLSEQKKKYYEDNKDYFVKQKKEYYQNNKDKFKQHLSMCECGKEIHGHKSRHIKSKKHIDWLVKQGENNQEIDQNNEINQQNIDENQ